jgi:hypothetical protein
MLGWLVATGSVFLVMGCEKVVSIAAFYISTLSQIAIDQLLQTHSFLCVCFEGGHDNTGFGRASTHGRGFITCNPSPFH